MEKEQFDEIREFAATLTQKRQVMADGPLLDQCQQHLNALVTHLADEFEEAPHIEEEPEQPATADRLVSALHAEPAPKEEPEPEHKPMHPIAEGMLRAHQPHHKKAPTKKHR